MRKARYFKRLGLAAIATLVQVVSAQADKVPDKFLVQGGCILQARAYLNPAYGNRESSRYDLSIVGRPKDSYQWDFTLNKNPEYHYTNLTGGISALPYRAKTQTTVSAMLHQFDIYEERVTFKNLDLEPLSAKNKSQFTPRYLSLKEPLTQTTASGISITLPAQEFTPQEAPMLLNGNPNALFIQIQTSPDQHEVVLPASPLFQKHGKPVRIKLECPKPNFMVWYQADNTFKTIAVGLPKLRTVKHLDELTFIVRQRVDLQAVSIALRVPITRQ